MKQRILIVSCTISLATRAIAQVGAVDPNRPHPEHEYDYEYQQEHEKKQKYTCPMHPEVVVDHPGNCPKARYVAYADVDAIVGEHCRSDEPRRFRHFLVTRFISNVWQNVHVWR